jgi:ADP-ribosylglycohydrolase
MACITGGIAEAFYGVPGWISEKAMGFLDLDLRIVQRKFSLFCGADL